MDNEKYLVSVIIPVYNSEKYIDDVLKAICGQSYKRLEIIIVDDGSTDKSAEIISKYRSDERIKYVVQNNSGVSAARNRGLENATGELIRFIDSDDFIKSDSIEKMILPFIENDQLDLVIGNFTYASMKFYVNEEENLNKEIDSKEFISMFLRRPRSFYYGAPWNKLFKRSIIEQNCLRFDEALRWCEDYFFNVSYYAHCEHVYLLNVPGGIYKYIDTPDSLTHKLNELPEGEIDRIHSETFVVGRNLAGQFGLDEAFELEWKYNSYYAKLSMIVQDNWFIINKYRLFKAELFAETDAIRYMKKKSEERPEKIWRMLYDSLNTGHCFKSFIYFYAKGIYKKWFEKITPTALRIKLKSKTPKNL